MVSQVEKGSPVERAGPRSGDIIVAYHGHPVGGLDDLLRLLTGEEVGRTADLTVIRLGRKETPRVAPALKQ